MPLSSVQTGPGPASAESCCPWLRDHAAEMLFLPTLVMDRALVLSPYCGLWAWAPAEATGGRPNAAQRPSEAVPPDHRAPGRAPSHSTTGGRSTPAVLSLRVLPRAMKMESSAEVTPEAPAVALGGRATGPARPSLLAGVPGWEAPVPVPMPAVRAATGRLLSPGAGLAFPAQHCARSSPWWRPSAQVTWTHTH